MPERFSGGFEQEPQEPAQADEPVRRVELPTQEDAPAARQSLFENMSLVASTIEEAARSATYEYQEPKESTFVSRTYHQALRQSFESIESRCFVLMAPMLETNIREEYPYFHRYSRVGLNDMVAPQRKLVDTGQDRQGRYNLLTSVLTKDELRAIQSLDALLDAVDMQRERKGLIAWRLFHTYKIGLGRQYAKDPMIRPWADSEFVNRLFPALSSEIESDITPLLELTEIDDVEGY